MTEMEGGKSLTEPVLDANQPDEWTEGLRDGWSFGNIHLFIY